MRLNETVQWPGRRGYALVSNPWQLKGPSQKAETSDALLNWDWAPIAPDLELTLRPPRLRLEFVYNCLYMLACTYFTFALLNVLVTLCYSLLVNLFIRRYLFHRMDTTLDDIYIRGPPGTSSPKI